MDILSITWDKKKKKSYLSDGYGNAIDKSNFSILQRNENAFNEKLKKAKWIRTALQDWLRQSCGHAERVDAKHPDGDQTHHDTIARKQKKLRDYTWQFLNEICLPFPPPYSFINFIFFSEFYNESATIT